MIWKTTQLSLPLSEVWQLVAAAAWPADADAFTLDLGYIYLYELMLHFQYINRADNYR